MKVDGKIIVYVDDTCLLFSGTNWNSLKQETECNFNKVFKWLIINKLTRFKLRSLNFYKILPLFLKKLLFIIVQIPLTVIA